MSGSYRHIEHLQGREGHTRPPRRGGWVLAVVVAAALLWWWLG